MSSVEAKKKKRRLGKLIRIMTKELLTKYNFVNDCHWNPGEM